MSTAPGDWTRPPSNRGLRVLAWALFLVTAGLMVAGVVSHAAWAHTPTGGVLGVVEGLVSRELVLAIIGLVLATRRPRNPIGWLFLAGSLVWSPNALGVNWITHLRDTGTPLGLPARIAIVGVDYQFFGVLTLSIVLPLLLLPDGRPTSRRWRRVVIAACAGLAMVVTGGYLAPGQLLFFPVPNPFALPGIGGTVATVLTTVGVVLIFVSGLLAPISLVLRFRRSRGTERQQLRWVAFGAVVTVTGIAAEVLSVFGVLPHDLGPGEVVVVLTQWALPVSIGLAVLRYRLWDLDRLISRTVAYALLTGLLALPYLILVPLAAQLAEGLGNLAVAAATLAVAALFQPLRRRVQAVVDRRFARRRYDAARSIDAFAGRLREQVDLDALARELVAVAEGTMQPTRVSLWLRASAR
jgi:hypothetical protein